MENAQNKFTHLAAVSTIRGGKAVDLGRVVVRVFSNGFGMRLNILFECGLYLEIRTNQSETFLGMDCPLSAYD
jgi:hypothetical protein